jgi:hypothetical protein
MATAAVRPSICTSVRLFEINCHPKCMLFQFKQKKLVDALNLKGQFLNLGKMYWGSKSDSLNKNYKPPFSVI